MLDIKLKTKDSCRNESTLFLRHPRTIVASFGSTKALDKFSKCIKRIKVAKPVKVEVVLEEDKEMD
jgi:hypothetical protein